MRYVRLRYYFQSLTLKQLDVGAPVLNALRNIIHFCQKFLSFMLIKQTICVRHGISSTQWVRKTVKKWCRTKQSCHNTNNVRYNPTRTIMSIPCGQHKPFYQFSQKKPLTSPKKKNIVFDKPIYVLSILSDKPWSIHWVQHIMYSTICPTSFLATVSDDKSWTNLPDKPLCSIYCVHQLGLSNHWVQETF